MADIWSAIDNLSYKQLTLLNLLALFFCCSVYLLYNYYNYNSFNHLSFLISSKTSQNSQPKRITLQSTPLPTPTPRPIPIKLQIPKLKINTQVIEVAYHEANMEMEVPQDAKTVGWYKYGPTPGENGASVINGHYDTVTGAPAIFYYLGKLAIGDDFYIDNNVGKQLKYKIIEVGSFPLDNFPMDKIYGNRDFSQVSLITCSGIWNPQTKLYSHRLTVIGKLDAIMQIDNPIAQKQTNPANQLLAQTFTVSSQARQEDISGVYLRLDNQAKVISLYLASNYQDVVAVDALIKYDPSLITINPEDISLSDNFVSYNISSPESGQYLISMFTDPKWRMKKALNTADKESKIAEITYKTVSKDAITKVELIKNDQSESSVVLKPVPGLDIHQSQNILENVRGINLTLY
jgi:LPXTG-site transpeptidase (sortase) family protein